MNITCPICGKVFREYVSAKRKYCSPLCSHRGARRTERPSMEALKEMIATTTWSAIGRMHGVSDNTVRAWARRYGLDV